MSEVEPKPLFKKRANRPPPRQREPEEAADEVKADEAREGSEGADEDKMTLEELLELRKLRRQRQGIDSTKLVEGASKRRRKKADDEEDEEEKYGLQKSSQRKEVEEEDDDDPDGVDAVAKKIIKSNNFTQQTNKLDVDKHMMSYIEQELEKRRGKPGSSNATTGSSSDPYAELFRISEKYKIEKKELEEGSVTNSSAMLTAIPEVDLGMDTRLKNIEDTEKAKRTVSENRKEARRPRDGNDERHLTATRFFNPHLKVQSDADAMRDAKLEAMGLPPEMDTRGYIKERDNRRDVATDEQVMERFKKRMRK